MEQFANVIERRVVGRSPKGTMEWHLVITDLDAFTTEWKPRVISTDGAEIIAEPKWMPLPGSQYSFITCPVFEALYEGERGLGKRILDTEPVLTDSGWKQAGSVVSTDRLVSIDGSYTKIKAIHKQPSGTIWRVKFDDGASLDVDDDHLWLVRSAKNGSRDGWCIRSTREIRARANYDGRVGRAQAYYIPTMTQPAPGKQWAGPDPYVIGLILGDGTTTGNKATIYTCDDFIVDYLVSVHQWGAYDYESQNTIMCCSKKKQSDAWKDVAGRRSGSDKRIEENLLASDPDTRLALLQGLMDSDGSVDKEGRCTFSSISSRLAEGVQYLVRSLGGKASIRWKKQTSAGVRGYANCGFIWKVYVQPCNKFVPFRLPRKVKRVKVQKGLHRCIVSIEQRPDGPATCFEVEHPSRLFVANDFIVTHNSIMLLADFSKEIGRFGSGWRGVVLRREFGDLDDLVSKAEDWYKRMFPGFKFLKSKSEYKAVWPTGEELLFRNFPDESAYREYHGWSLPWIGWEELTQWENSNGYKLMMSCSRPIVPGSPTRIRSTTNPYGPGKVWVQRRFKLPKHRGKVIRIPGELPRVAIRGMLAENFVLLHTDPSYLLKVASAARNESEKAAWTRGDWTVSAGGIIDDVWDDNINVIPRINPRTIPRSWSITRAYDHGQAHPFAVGWWAESNGEPIRVPTTDGSFRWVGRVRGDLVLVNEWYGNKGEEENTGIKMSSKNIAAGILDRETDMGIRRRVIDGPADTEIFNKDSDRDGKCPADDMSDAGVEWERADKSAGSRRRGWTMLRERVEGAKPNQDGTREKPGLFVCENCTWWLALVVPMPRSEKDPDDVPEKYPDHLGDMTRYRLSWDVPGGGSRNF